MIKWNAKTWRWHDSLVTLTYLLHLVVSRPSSHNARGSFTSLRLFFSPFHLYQNTNTNKIRINTFDLAHKHNSKEYGIRYICFWMIQSNMYILFIHYLIRIQNLYTTSSLLKYISDHPRIVKEYIVDMHIAIHILSDKISLACYVTTLQEKKINEENN